VEWVIPFCNSSGSFNPSNANGVLAVLSYVALSKSRVSFVHEDAAVGIRDLLPFLVPAMNLTFRGEEVDSDCKTRWRGLRDKAEFRRLKVNAE